MNPLVIIPARLASTRLPNKPLADIHGEPMIVHVWRRAVEAEIGEVLVAASDENIAEVIHKVGGKVILTNPHLPSGSDRIWEALQTADPRGYYDTIINLQGDLPTIDPALIQAVLSPLDEPSVDISTLAAIIKDPEEIDNPNVVKAILTPIKGSDHIFKALYFTRAGAPCGAGLHYHHIGLYAYKREALERFVTLPPSYLEKQERLEQLRALEDDMTIQVCIVDTIPLGVDTQDDLERAREILSHKQYF
jgi:3-deoxy-manno-octulosonate cytidylyltransferase (CMP-KDO synthetase)